MTWFAILAGCDLSLAQPTGWLWAQGPGGNRSEIGSSAVTDGSGNCYVTGDFVSDSILVGGFTLYKQGASNVFVAKYDSMGNVIWARRYGDAEISPHDITIDSMGNYYITGGFRNGNVMLDSISLVNHGNLDIFVAKFNDAGSVLWAKASGGSRYEFGRSLAVDYSGNCYVTGSFSSDTIVFDADTLFLSSLSISDNMFIVKYDSMGNVVWSKSGHGENIGNDIALDPSGSCYVVGQSTYGSIDTVAFPGLGFREAFLLKYGPAGNFRWMSPISGTRYNAANGIAVDMNGFSYITGTISGTSVVIGSDVLIPIGGLANDGFVAKYDSTGQPEWARSFGGTGSDGGGSIAIDGAGGVYVAGGFSSDPISFETTSIFNHGVSDGFVAKYDSSGHFESAAGFGGSGQDAPMGITADNNGSFYVVGYLLSDSMFLGPLVVHNSSPTDFGVFVARSGTIITQVPELIPANVIRLYPNPLTDRAVLTTGTPFHQARVTVDNMLGQRVMEMDNISGKTVTLQRHGLPDGVYIVRILENNRVLATLKVILTGS